MKRRFLLQTALAFALLLGTVAYTGRLLNLTGDWTLDLVGRETATLTPETKDFLKRLDDQLNITYFATAREKMPTHLKEIEPQVRRLLAALRNQAPQRIDYRVIDPALSGRASIGYAARKKASSFSVRKVLHDEHSEEKIWSSLVVSRDSAADVLIQGIEPEPSPVEPIEDARVLVKVGDSVTTDHISPAGAFPSSGPAGKYLMSKGVEPRDFNSFGSRRGNHEVMIRGTFANIRMRNQTAPGTEGGLTTHFPTNEVVSIHEASERYQSESTQLVVLAGSQYGSGSSRDWAAKGTFLLGVRAVIAKSYERIHRSNLVGMGVLPLAFSDGADAESLGLDGTELYSIPASGDLDPFSEIIVTAEKGDGTVVSFPVIVRLETPVEVEYYRNGGILQTVLRNLAKD